MKAIYIKWFGPTNTKGTRIKASDNDGNSITISRNYEIDSAEQGARAAHALCKKMDWETNLIGNGDVFLFENEEKWSCYR